MASRNQRRRKRKSRRKSSSSQGEQPAVQSAVQSEAASTVPSKPVPSKPVPSKPVPVKSTQLQPEMAKPSMAHTAPSHSQESDAAASGDAVFDDARNPPRVNPSQGMPGAAEGSGVARVWGRTEPAIGESRGSEQSVGLRRRVERFSAERVFSSVRVAGDQLLRAPAGVWTFAGRCLPASWLSGWAWPSQAVPCIDSIVAPVAAGILGFSIAMVSIGALRVFPGLGLPLHVTPSVVAGVVLLCLGIGVRMPRKVAAWFVVLVQRGISMGIVSERWLAGSRLAAVTAPLKRKSSADALEGRAMHWTVLGVLSLMCGLAMALTPAIHRCMVFGWFQLAAGFVWSDVSLVACTPIFAGLSLFFPVTCAALCFSCLYRLSIRDGAVAAGPIAGLLAGASLGLVSATNLEAYGMASWLMPVAASLGPLSVALLSVGIMPRFSSDAVQETGDCVSMPEFEMGAAWLLRLALLPFVSALVLLSSLLVYEIEFRGLRIMGAAGHLLFVSLGMAGARLVGGHRLFRSVAGVGMMMALTGYVASLIPAFWGDVDRVGASGAPWLVAFYALFMVAGGFTLQCAYSVLSLASGFSTMTEGRRLSHAGLVAGCSLLVLLPFAESLMRAFVFLAATGMSLLAIGGTLVIHEPNDGVGRKRFRLAMIFVGIGLIMAVSWCRP